MLISQDPRGAPPWQTEALASGHLGSAAPNLLIDKINCRIDILAMSTATARVLHDEVAAASVLDPVRRRILTALQQPGSSSTVARALDLPRQRVNYHVRALEKAGLVEEV